MSFSHSIFFLHARITIKTPERQIHRLLLFTCRHCSIGKSGKNFASKEWKLQVWAWEWFEQYIKDFKKKVYKLSEFIRREVSSRFRGFVTKPRWLSFWPLCVNSCRISWRFFKATLNYCCPQNSCDTLKKKIQLSIKILFSWRYLITSNKLGGLSLLMWNRTIVMMMSWLIDWFRTSRPFMKMA